MADSGRIPWPRVHECLFHLSSCRNRGEFFSVASSEIQALIPFDAGCGFYRPSDGQYLDGIGLTESVVTAYNGYYRTRRPSSIPENGLPASLVGLVHVLDWRTFARTEFAVDFMLRNGLSRSLFGHVLPRHAVSLAVHRSRSALPFSGSEMGVAGLFSDFLNDYCSGLEKRAETSLTVQRITDTFGFLSRREAEVCSLVALRLNRSEIAACLCISPRTVEKHIESIFDKLDVRSREQLRWRLGVFPPAGRLPG